MKCPKCNSVVKKVEVEIENAEQKVVSYQCIKCDFFEFEKKSAANVINELRSKN